MVLGSAGLLVLVVLWWAAVQGLAAPGSLVRRFGPGTTFVSFWQLLASGELWPHILVSLERVLIGLGLAALVGVPLGLLVGAWRTLETATTPAFQFLRMISPLSWMPLAVMVMGVGDKPIYFLLAFAAVWPILLNTVAGVRGLDPRWLQLAHSLSATRWEILRRVILPGVLGQVLTGVRLAIGILWIVLVPCEMLGVSAGLGYYILDTRDRLAYGELMALVLLIGLLGFTLDVLARQLHQRFLPRR
ncbi:ABC transporter permease [Pseudomonas oryzihabitans]|uniref:ABC transporter permease n=1 Tax=Pseudomonas oryzihabitans TaxID=47885 RepID=UPI00135DB78F|nr:ABC transporter permease [Pseudomonas oryzihabitans]MXS18351.1 ABC transporter permease subunit [Pseudomonas oryzihabitans]